MKEEFVTYDQALALKELGFDEPCMGYYKDEEFKVWNFYDPYKNSEMREWFVSAPLKQQVFRWFRENHKIHSIIQEYLLNTYMYTIDDGINDDISVVGYETYEEAESACIDKLIELIKNK